MRAGDGEECGEMASSDRAWPGSHQLTETCHLPNTHTRPYLPTSSTDGEDDLLVLLTEELLAVDRCE